MKKVVVGSENPVKAEAARAGFARVWPDEAWEITGVAAASGVSDQPMSDREAIAGARARARAALAAVPDAVFGVGLEGGLQQTEGHWFDSGWAVIVDRADTEGIGSTLRMVSPPAIMQHVLAGMELGHVDDLVFGSANSKQQQGHYGLMTGGALTRTDGYAQGVVAALARWVRPQLWEVYQTPSVTICGSIAFYSEMEQAAEELTRLGVEAHLPPGSLAGENGEPISAQQYYSVRKDPSKHAAWVWLAKRKLILLHFEKISRSDAILVLNYAKNGVGGYIGANTLLEMGLALHLSKPIFLLNPVPELPYTEEILGMQPVVLDGDVARLPELLRKMVPIAASA